MNKNMTINLPECYFCIVSAADPLAIFGPTGAADGYSLMEKKQHELSGSLSENKRTREERMAARNG